MRKLLIPLLTVAFVMAFSNSLYAQFTGDGFKQTIIGTEHDMTTHGEVTGGVALCEYCHAPHKLAGMGNGPGPTPAVPLLWNIQLHTGPYAVYGGSSTFNATDIASPTTADSTHLAAYMTLLCLSCHDGTITQSSFYYDEVLGTITDFTDIPNIGEGGGLGLSNDHPVNFTYSAALATADGGLQTPTEGVSVTIPYVGASVALPLFKDTPSDASGKLECATCHNPHNHTNDYFLRVTNETSAICLNCHGTI